MRITRKLRREIEGGDLLSVAEGLASENPEQMYKAMIAMEMSGLSERRLTVAKKEQTWHQVRDKQ